MNFEHAKTISTRQILAKIGYEPQTELPESLVYQSPFCSDPNSSFAVNINDNTWLDLCIDKGGHAVDFVCEYLMHSGESHSIADALRWLKNMMKNAAIKIPDSVPDFSKIDEKFIISKLNYLSSPYLIRYLEETRHIPFEYAQLFLKEAQVLNQKTGKSFWALVLINEDGGYAIRNQYTKAHLGPKRIKFIRGLKAKPDGVHIFKDFMDYLSVLATRNGAAIDDDTIILNGYHGMADGAAYIGNYGYKRAHTWFDNGMIGNEVTNAFAEFFKTEPDLLHVSENTKYLPFYDVNLWHVSKTTAIKEASSATS